MNSIEDQLRDAYRAAADTVEPDGIRQFDEQSVMISRRSRPPVRFGAHRTIVPLAAASAVALIAALTGVVVPRLIGGTSSGPENPSPVGRFLVAVSGDMQKSLTIRNAFSGASVAAIAAPHPGLMFSGLATGDGRHYVAVLWRSGTCRSWLYQFRLNRAGRPSPLIPYSVPAVDQLLGPVAVSMDNSMFAYLGEQCANPAGAPSDLTAVNIVTHQSKSWSIPKQADLGSLSLTAHGRSLAYSISPTKLFRSAAYVLPTNAPGGAALQRSRLVAKGSRFGSFKTIGSSVITPDGSRLFFTTSSAAAAHSAWQLRVADLASGRIRVVGRYAGFPEFLTAGPEVHQALVVVQGFMATPSPSPSEHPSSAPSGPTPSPSLSPEGPTAAPSASPSVSPGPSTPGPTGPTPSVSPSQAAPLAAVLAAAVAPSGSHSAAPRTAVPQVSPVSQGAGQPAPTLELINLRTGASRLLLSSWNPGGTIFTW